MVSSFWNNMSNIKGILKDDTVRETSSQKINSPMNARQRQVNYIC